MTERYRSVPAQREFQESHRELLSDTQRNGIDLTTNQGVACSNQAGCTIRINKLGLPELEALLMEAQAEREAETMKTARRF